MYKFPTTEELFDLSRSIVGDLIKNCEYPHLALSKIDDFINQCIPMLDETYRQVDEGIYIAKDAVVWDGATIVAPTIIGRKAEIRPGAFIRGGVIIGNGAVIGNSTEVKNSIIFDEAQLPHYNYVGDSIIGHRAHMGAGAIASNLRLDKSEVIISYGEEKMPTGLRKVGVFLGDRAEVGCGCVLCPGATIGRESVVSPLVRVVGCIPPDRIYDGQTIKIKK